MKQHIIAIALAGIFSISSVLAEGEDKLVSKTGHISFFSHTDLEDITANNYKVVSTLNPTTGEVVFSVPMQSFEFEKAAMQKHYNSSKFLDTKTFPKAKFKGNIEGISDIDLSKNGTYEVKVNGELEIHGVTKAISESGTITVKDGKITVNAKMNITLADYEIAFEKGKPSTNIAKTVELTIIVEYTL